MEISLEDDERTLTMVEDLCSEDVAGNASCLSPAPLADDRDAAAAGASAAVTSRKTVKDNEEKILTELEEAIAKLTVVHDDLREFFAIQLRLCFLVSKENLLELAGDKMQIYC